MKSLANSQAVKKGDFTVNGGVGYSLIGSIFRLTLDNAKAVNSEASGGGTPVINGMVDYAVTDIFSIGVAGSYQTYTINFSDDDSQKWSCLNIGVRPLFHFGTGDNLDLYTGARISVTSWNFTSTIDDNTFFTAGDVTLPGFGLQPLFGGTYYFTDNIGLNMELGLFGTYLAAAGINAKF